MCVILTAKGSQLVEAGDIVDMVSANGDGTGIAWAEGGEVHLKRWLEPSDAEVSAFWAELEGRGVPRMLHARLATHGGVVKKLVHPFRLSDGSVLAHNGIIHGVNPKKWESDTAAFVREYVEPLIEELGDAWLKPAVLAALGAVIGSYNKLAILTPTGDFRLVNAGSGRWLPSGVWVSNTNWFGASSWDYEPLYSHGGGAYGKYWDDKPMLPAGRTRYRHGCCEVCGDERVVEYLPGYWGEAEYLCTACARGLGVSGK